MVGRITKGRNLRGVLEYNARKVAAGKASVLYGNRVLGQCGPAETFDMKRALRSFQPYLESDHAISDPVFHVSLNPDKRDELSDDQLSEIAQEYMQRMGFGDQPYYVFKHRDIERQHIHIVSVKVRDDGSAITDSNDFRRSKAILQEIERKYDLHVARAGVVQQTPDTIRKVEYGSEDLTAQLRAIVRQLADGYRFGSIGEFRTLLNSYNVDMEQRRGITAGKPYEGIVYTATDDQGVWQGRPIKASALTPKGSIDYLRKQIAKNTGKIKDERIKAPIRRAVAHAMYRAKGKEDFVELLKADGIEAVLRQNSAGRIVGATFIDHNSRTVLNGSRLGKSYSANTFEELFHNPLADRAALLPELASKPSISVSENNPPHLKWTTEPSRQSPAAQTSNSWETLMGRLGETLLDGNLSEEEFEARREELQQHRRKRRKIFLSK